ncbi:glycosyltransferase family 4 protein [Falsibacillus pallidus]|uniref:glycosyltransferase family 4 protein n=1 Tax=Falsibacillus pallidus TaxID=493781 RepID=UPI003D97FB7F
MKIALFTDTFFPQVNGVARTLKRYIDYLESQGIEYQVFVPSIEDCPAYPNIHQFASYPFFFYKECRTAVVLPRTVEVRLKEFSPDIIHVATPLTMGLIGARLAKKLGIPAVASYHTHFDQYLEYFKLKWLSSIVWKYMKWFHDPFQRIFVPSQETYSYLLNRSFQNISIWSRGVDSDLYHPMKKTVKIREKYQLGDRKILLYVGRLSPEKDVEILNQVIQQFPESYKNQIHWLIVGDGPSRMEMQSKLAGHPVTFTGYLGGEELAEVYASSDLFVFPSASETFGNVVLEAMASGLPVITSNKGGVKNIVKHGKNGYMCPEKNVNEFIQSISDLLNNDRHATLMGMNARSYAEDQKWDVIFKSFLTELREIAFGNQEFFKRNA